MVGVAMKTTPLWDGAYRGTSPDPWVGGTAPCGWERAWGCLWLFLPAGLMPAVQMWMNVAWVWRGVTHGQRASTRLSAMSVIASAATRVMASHTVTARAWKTVATVCVAVPRTSLVCVTWVGPQICHHPHLPQDPLPHAALETVAATFTVTAAGGDLATVMSARTGHGGNTVNGAGLAALAMQRALVAADPASVTGMETHVVATVTTSVGSASARTILRVPTVRFALQDTMGTPELVAPASGSVGVVPSSPTCPQWLWALAALGDFCLQVVGQQELGPACPTVCGLSQPQKHCSPVPLGPSVPHSPSPSLQTAAPLAH